MSTIIQPFINLLLFKAGPQDMPSSPAFLKTTMFAYFITNVVKYLKIHSLSAAVLASTGEVFLFAGFIIALLSMNDKKERANQTLIALFGTLTILNIAVTPFLHSFQFSEDGTLAFSTVDMLTASIQVWVIITIIRVVRDALEISAARAFILVILINFLMAAIMSGVAGVLGIEMGGLILPSPEQ